MRGGEADRAFPGRSGLPSGEPHPAGGGEEEGEGLRPSPVRFHTKPPLREGGGLQEREREGEESGRPPLRPPRHRRRRER